MTKDDVKWNEVENPEDWYCDICQRCTDPECCDKPIVWLKHPNTKTEPHFRGVAEWYEGRLEDMCVCNECFEKNHQQMVQKWLDYPND